MNAFHSPLAAREATPRFQLFVLSEVPEKSSLNTLELPKPSAAASALSVVVVNASLDVVVALTPEVRRAAGTTAATTRPAK
jgi:hypothetical protein